MIYLLDADSGILRFAHDAGIADAQRRRWIRRLELPLGAGIGKLGLASRTQAALWAVEHKVAESPKA